MLRAETPYTTCTDPACATIRCRPCSLTPPIHSCCRGVATCPTTGDEHRCRGGEGL
jgi:hypothetical protein